MDIKGDFVIGIPNRDVLLVTGSEDQAGIDKAKSIIKKSLAESWSYPVSSELFIYRDGKFELCPQG